MNASPAGRNTLHAALFMTPFLAVYLALLVYPFILGLWMSLHDWELLSAAAGIQPAFIGLGNYQRLIHDPIFWSSFGHSAIFALLATPAVTITALFLALALNRRTRVCAVLRAVFFISGIFSVTVVTMVWLAIISPSRGLLGELFPLLGVEPVNLLADRRFAMPLLVLVTVWWSAGFPMALFLAGLQQIPQEVYEAAALDQATPWRQFTGITLPALRRTTFLVIITQLIAHFQVFGQVLLLTGGGPANSTRVLVQYIYETSFRDWEVGYATANSVVLFVLMLLASLAQLRISRREEA